MMYFDMGKFWRKLKELKLGTATLGEQAGVLGSGGVLKLIALGCIDDEIGEKIVEVLGEDVLEDSLQNEDGEEEDYADLDKEIDSTVENFAIADYSINQIKEKIGNGEIGLGKTLRLEQAQDDPRTTLLKWLEEQLEE